jgi:hypothetical protein
VWVSAPGTAGAAADLSVLPRSYLGSVNINATAGYSVRQTSRRLYGEATRKALGAVLLLALGVAIGAEGGGGVGACLLGGGMLLAIEAHKRSRSARGFRLGAVAEERVGALLFEVERRGWLVEHDVAKRGGGNVDHVIHSPSVTFTIDTKRSTWRSADLGQAHRHADWAARHYEGRRPIVPVICVQRSGSAPEFLDGVHVVGAARLVDFLLDRG